MKSTLVALISSLLLVGSANAASSQLPTLSKPDAVYYTKLTLTDGLGFAFIDRAFQPGMKCNRLAPSAVKCRVSWLGNSPSRFYQGNVWTSYSRDSSNQLWLRFRYVIRSCLYNEGHCEFPRRYAKSTKWSLPE